MSDNEIVELISAKNEKGLSELFDKYSSALNGVVYRILGDSQIAEEVISQSFLKVWDKIGSYNPDKSEFFTWVMAIARNTALDQRRLKSFGNRRKTDPLEGNVYTIKMDMPSSTIETERILRMVDTKYKVVLEKIYLEGYSQSEAAELLEIPLGTVKTRLRKAISILREELKDEKNLLLSITIIVLVTMLIIR